MEIAKIEIATETLQSLVDCGVISTNDFKVIAVDENSYDYTKNELWLTQKKVADKEYKKLKEIEFNIRHK